MTMRPAEPWVVYRNPADGFSGGTMGVCRAAEWAALDAARPGALTLVRDDVPSEGLAEQLARGTTGDSVPRTRPARGPLTAGAPSPAEATGSHGGPPRADAPDHLTSAA